MSTTAFVNTSTSLPIKIAVNGIETTNIFGYKIRLWNSGSVPLTMVPVRFAFEVTSTNFHVFNVSHTTTPKRDFGKIDENGSDASSKRFIYELLNPNDEDVLTFVTDVGAPLSIFAKAEGLRTKFVKVESPMSKFLSVANMFLGVLSSVICLFYLIQNKKGTKAISPK